MAHPGKLIFFCSKMAAGKSTLARVLATRENGILLVQDELLDGLYPGEISSLSDYRKLSSRLNATQTPHLCDLLRHGATVVLDFPGNTRRQRAWFREVLEGTGAEHELHFLDVTDEDCKRQLRRRSAGLPEGTPWTTEAEFDAVTAYFEPPTADEGFRIVPHSHRTSK